MATGAVPAGAVPTGAVPAGAVPVALQFALNRLFVVTANMGSVFEDVSLLSFCSGGSKLCILSVTLAFQLVLQLSCWVGAL